MIRKDVIIAILATFCLTATLFIVIPTKSSPSAGPEYDPSADINGDGKINMYDIGYTAQRYGASGDPMKNMNVTNWPTEQPDPSYKLLEWWPQPSNVSWTDYGMHEGFSAGSFDVGGYSKVFLYIKLTNLSYAGLGTTTIYFSDAAYVIDDGFSVQASSWDYFDPNVCNVTVHSWEYGMGYFSNCMRVEPRGNWLQPGIDIVSTIPEGAATLNVYVYLTN
jgi:hypothetical protein